VISFDFQVRERERGREGGRERERERERERFVEKLWSFDSSLWIFHQQISSLLY